MVSPLTVVDHFAPLLDGFVLDAADAAFAPAVHLPTHVTATLMTDLESKRRLAEEVLAFAAGLVRDLDAPSTSLDARLSTSS
jgi:hypothetical protein